MSGTMSNKASTQSERPITHYLFSTQRPLTVIPFPPERLQQAEELCERLKEMQKEEFWHIAK